MAVVPRLRYNPAMQIERVSYAGTPERVTEESFDCVWVLLNPRKTPSPLASQVLQWVDWKMQGVLSRFVLEKKTGKSQTIFVPTMKRLGAPLVALESPGDTDWEAFAQNCKGMGLKQVLVLCEQGAEVPVIEKEIRRQSASGLERVVLGSDDPVGRS